jgi:protein gp37
MSAITGIEWTDRTWNPTVGCDRVSPGCARCYAKTLHDRRHEAVGRGAKLARQYSQPFETVQLMPGRLSDPLGWRKPARVFVNSVSDLFHDDVPDEFIARVFAVMALAWQHTFQVLTKRPARMREWVRGVTLDSLASVGMREALAKYGPVLSGRDDAWIARNGDAVREQFTTWPLPNVWLGVSVENQRWADERIPLLMQTPAAKRFLSCEPLLGPVDLRWHLSSVWPGIDWVIVGGESGNGAREMRPEWAQAIRDECTAHDVAFFFKQWGGERDKRGHDAALLDGVQHHSFPA